MKKEKPIFVGFRLYKKDRVRLQKLAHKFKCSRAEVTRIAIEKLAFIHTGL